MRISFVYYVMDQGGSAQDVHNYARIGRALGHEVVLYGRPHRRSLFPLSKDIDSADAVFFIFEWTQRMRYGDNLDLARLVGRVPRKRRFIIDCDGAYNDQITVQGDYNHRDANGSQEWMRICHSVSDRIFQPTLHPLRPNVQTFLFHGYDPGWERPIEPEAKDYTMVYVGHSKFRWGPMCRVLRALEGARERPGRIGLVGHGWDSVPDWAGPMGIEHQFYTDQSYLKKFEVDFVGEVAFDQVIPWMSKGVFSPVLYRPLFSHLRLVTCRTFETPAAGTIPVFDLDEQYVSEIYGERAAELVLPASRPEEKIWDILCRPGYYAGVVMDIRQGLAERHSYEARFRELIKIVDGA